MNLFSRIGAFLTGGPADEAVLAYAARLAEAGGAAATVVVGMPEDGPLDGGGKTFERRVGEGWSGAEPAPEIVAHEKPSLDEILDLTRKRDLDLLVLGRRIPSHQLAHTSLYPRVVRKAPCDILLVTGHARPAFDRILVPVDFSPHSRRALELALRLRQAVGTSGGEVLCHHVFEVPYGYAYAGVSRADFAREQQEHAEEEFARFASGLPTGGEEVRCLYTPSDHVAPAVGEMALAEKVDLVAMGSRGRTGAAALLLGSATEKLVGVCAAPILVVKQKGETMGFLDAVLGG